MNSHVFIWQLQGEEQTVLDVGKHFRANVVLSNLEAYFVICTARIYYATTDTARASWVGNLVLFNKKVRLVSEIRYSFKKAPCTMPRLISY